MKKILIVDDSATIQRMLKHTLQRVGYDVIAASSGRQALDQLAHTAFDLAIVDVSMPGMGGFELLQHIREDETQPHLPVIMLTASGDQADKRAAQRLGADAFLNKPVSSSELLDALTKAALVDRQSVQPAHQPTHQPAHQPPLQSPTNAVTSNRLNLVSR